MVTVLYRQRHGYDVLIHTDDHPPAHVHVWKGNRELIIELRQLRIRKMMDIMNAKSAKSEHSCVSTRHCYVTRGCIITNRSISQLAARKENEA